MFVEQVFEPTYPLCPCDLVIQNTTIYFTKPLSWQFLLFQVFLTFLKPWAKIYFESEVFQTKYSLNL